MSQSAMKKIPNPSYQWREDSVMTVVNHLSSWVLYCDGITVRDTFGFPIVFETKWEAKVYARDILKYEQVVLTIE